MNGGTPRLRSSYPSTPDNTPGSAVSSGLQSGVGGPRQTPQGSHNSSSRTPTQAPGPLIPLTVLDAPSQRFYAFAIYIALLAWRLYDWAKLVEDEADSFWLFIKWVATDGIFLYGLPGMRIPWLEWTNPVISAIFMVHAALNAMLMFRIPIPIEAWLAVLVRTLYDRELSVSENRVKPSNILYNSSLIMGKQIINVLPEGSATLNPDRLSLCIDREHPSVVLPIYLNQTQPVYIELLRIDFATSLNETLVIGTKEVQALRKKAQKRQSKQSPESHVLEYEVGKPGLYRLHKVLERSKLEVQRRMSDTLVVNCPGAVIQPSVSDRCVGDLSNLTIDVVGTPPLKIVYSRTINKEDQSFHFQSLQPENLVSPFLGGSTANALALQPNEDVSWGQSHTVTVRLNESMTPGGRWLYSIDEIHDATGNIANFSSRGEDGEHMYPKGTHLEHAFTVHERPVARLEHCNTRNPLRVAKGMSSYLPIKLGPLSKTHNHTAHYMTWLFSPIESLTDDGNHGADVTIQEFTARSPRDKPRIRQPGLYTLKSIKSQYCDGEIKEPASCLLLNPPVPDLTISSEDIYDKCAGNSIGILVDMDLIGTPPFVVRYDIIQDKQKRSHSIAIEGSRHQLELKPQQAGHFKYQFTTIDDDIYKGQPLDSRTLTLEQDVKPPASAHLVNTPREFAACIDQSVHLQVQFSGEPPFTLEFELLHDGQRLKRKLTGIETNMYKISTEPLVHSGEYLLALASMQDRTGCKIFLNNEIKINVRQKPKASFGQLDGQRKILTLEGKQIGLPLRLEGEAPWTIGYRNLNDSASKVIQALQQYSNDFVKIDQRGLYELIEVSDNHCPGVVDASAAVFEVIWISRPEVKIAESSGLTFDGKKHVKREVCEGDLDATEINLIGSPPFHLKYQQRYRPERGSHSVSIKEIDAALGVVTVPMDTTKAGTCTYEFSELSDNVYDHNSKKYTPVVMQQIVNPKPSAQFTKPGQSYKYCKQEEGVDEVIPITLQGVPPFSLELDIKHQSSTRPQTIKIPNIDSNQYEFRIPHRLLSLGTHQVSVRKVRDARGCQRKTEHGAPHVQLQVFDVPSIFALESQTDYCVGDRISYTISGTPPFDIYYTFGGVSRKAKSPNTNFRRIAEKPGNFTITAVSDKASECKAVVDIRKIIHEMPSVKISQGRQVSVDIHEGGETQIVFDFWGTPPFEFTYTRSTNAKKGHKSVVLETRHETSYEHRKKVPASQEGTYEVVAIKDKFCSFSTQRVEAKVGQRLLQ